MSDAVPYAVVGVLVAAGFAVQFLIARGRGRRSYREHLEPILAEHGLRFVSERWPGWFRVGPFPKLEFETGRPQTQIGGIGGDYNVYRIVTVQDAAGGTHELWARLEFESFRLCRVRWRAAENDDLPEAAAVLLER